MLAAASGSEKSSRIGAPAHTFSSFDWGVCSTRVGAVLSGGGGIIEPPAPPLPAVPPVFGVAAEVVTAATSAAPSAEPQRRDFDPGTEEFLGRLTPIMTWSCSSSTTTVEILIVVDIDEKRARRRLGGWKILAHRHLAGVVLIEQICSCPCSWRRRDRIFVAVVHPCRWQTDG